MKILHLIFSKQVAGAEKYLLDLLPGLKQSGVDCSLICVIPEPDAHKFIDFKNELNAKGVETNIFTGDKSSFLSVARQINGYLKAHDIKHLHAHLFSADLLAVMVKMIFNRRLFILSTKHGYQESYFNKHPVNPGKIDYNIYYCISKFINARIDAQVTISKAMSDLYYNLKLTKQKIPFIHHGINLNASNTVKTNTKEGPRLIIVGRIEEIKGHIYLFKAMPTVIKEFASVKLSVLGNGTQKENLLTAAKELKIEDNINFMGFQSNPYDYISASDIIILPSLFEPFGLVYIEAFALKVPVIAFDVQACNEIIVNNDTGILVPLYAVDKLAEKIIYLLKNPTERIRIAENAYQRYVNYFNTARMVTETITWYKSIIND